jgi:hypothetical protein
LCDLVDGAVSAERDDRLEATVDRIPSELRCMLARLGHRVLDPEVRLEGLEHDLARPGGYRSSLRVRDEHDLLHATEDRAD